MKTLLIAISAFYLVGCASRDRAPRYVAPSTSEAETKIGSATDSVKRASEANTQTAEAITKAQALNMSLKQKLELLKKGELE